MYLVAKLLLLVLCLLLFFVKQRTRLALLLVGYIMRICFPRWLILNLFTLVAIIIIYQSFQNPTYFLEGKSNAFNRRALLAVLEELETEPFGATIITSISLAGTTPVRSFQVMAKP